MQKMMNMLENFSKKQELDSTLMASFMEAKKNENLEDLLKKISLPYEELCKYTSFLEESAEEFHQCKNCKGLFACKNKIEGFAYLPRIHEGKIGFGYTACKYKKQLDKENQYLKNVYCIDIPKEIRNAKMKDIYIEDKNRFKTIKWLKKFLETYKSDPNQKGLYLFGNFGCGKTYLIAAAFNELAKQNVKSAIVFWPDLLRNLKSKFQGNYEEEIERLKKVPLLCLDDIGAETTTSWSRDEVLCPIIQYRMQEHLPTFFTSNLDYKTLEQHFSISKDGIESIKARRIVERIKQLTEPIEMISENLRK